MTHEERLSVLEDLLELQLERLENGVSMELEEGSMDPMLSEGFDLALNLLDRIEEAEDVLEDLDFSEEE